MKKKTLRKRSPTSPPLKTSQPNTGSKRSKAPSALLELGTALQHCLQKLALDSLARSSGFRRRTPKKLTPLLFVQATCLLVTLGSLSYRRWAGLIGLLGQCTLSKQGLFERIGPRAVNFLQSVLQSLLVSLSGPGGGPTADALLCFGRVLLHDSTTLRLADKLAAFFPGARNQRGPSGGLLKIQAVYDLLCQDFVHFSLSSFRRNDQAAANDVLGLLRPRDLVVRDLGYFVLESLERIALAQAYFLSRLRLGVVIWDKEGRRPLDLLKLLRQRGHVDIDVRLGDKKLPVRLVARPLPEPVAAERRRRARVDRDRRSRPSARRLALLGWAIFITNVPRTVWSAPTVAQMYGLRWRIETIFKAWKSHFALAQMPTGSKEQVEAIIYARLIFISLFQVCFWRVALEQASLEQRPALSLLKVAQAVQSLLLAVILNQTGVDAALGLEQLIGAHCRYERRRRRHFLQEVDWTRSQPEGSKGKSK